MYSNNLQLNPNISSIVLRVGDEKTPVIIIDDYITDTESVVAYVGQRINFDAEKHTYYPGFRAQTDEDYKNFVVRTIGDQLFKPFNAAGFRLIADSSYYSLVATPPDKLTAGQCRPHADTARPYYLAVMHYLGSGEHGGTGFFKHKPTGFEKVSAHRLDKYVQSVAAFDKAHNGTQQGYITDTTDQYELIGSVGYKPNRVIIYPGCLLHSGLIKPESDISKDPRTGRLTANVFLDFVP